MPQSRNFKSAFAETAAGDDADRIRRTTIYFDKRDEALAVDAVRIFNAKLFQSEHRHAYAQHLARTEMPMGVGGIV